MRQRTNLLDSISSSFAPINREGHAFIGIGLLVTIVLLVLWPSLGWLAAVLTAGLACFFRDPDRVVPLREGLIVSASDGIVIGIDEVAPEKELGIAEVPRLRIAIHLSLFDVHVTRAPVAGRVARCLYIPGSFLNPTLDKASNENERRITVIETSSGLEIPVVQIAGVITRRIVGFVEPGEAVGIGERIGMIRFGSRVDLLLPRDAAVLVAVGQRMIAGETVIADLKSDEALREARAV